MVHTTGPGPSIRTSSNGDSEYRPGMDDADEVLAMRLEKDSLGEREVPVDAYWGIHTARA